MEGPGLCPKGCRCPHGTAGCLRHTGAVTGLKGKKNGLKGIKAPSVFCVLDPLQHETGCKAKRGVPTNIRLCTPAPHTAVSPGNGTKHPLESPEFSPNPLLFEHYDWLSNNHHLPSSLSLWGCHIAQSKAQAAGTQHWSPRQLSETHSAHPIEMETFGNTAAVNHYKGNICSDRWLAGPLMYSSSQKAIRERAKGLFVGVGGASGNI